MGHTTHTHTLYHSIIHCIIYGRSQAIRARVVELFVVVVVVDATVPLCIYMDLYKLHYFR